MEEFMSVMGYPLENHYVTTKDGYILHMHRIPAKNSSAPVVFLQHGILASSWCWLVNEEDRAPGLQLWHMGYDVWLGNSRGNTYSRNHTTLKPTSKEFWNFTFADMPLDIEATVPYVIKTAGVATLSYMGWSQANSAMLVAGSASPYAPELASKINLWAALSPVSFMKHSTSSLLSVVSALHIGAAVYDAFPYGFLDGKEAQDTAEQFFCKITLGELCKLSVDAVCGTSALDDTKYIEALTSHFPAGTAVKDLVHYEQLIGEIGNSEGEFFGAFNYGAELNQEYYHQKTPPAFELGSFAGPPVALFAAGNDALVNAKDYAVLESTLKNSKIVFNKTYKGFSHLTWLVGNPQAWSWFDDLKALLVKHNPVPH